MSGNSSSPSSAADCGVGCGATVGCGVGCGAGVDSHKSRIQSLPSFNSLRSMISSESSLYTSLCSPVSSMYSATLAGYHSSSAGHNTFIHEPTTGLITELGAGFGCGAVVGCTAGCGVVVAGVATDAAGRSVEANCGAGVVAMWTTISVASDVGSDVAMAGSWRLRLNRLLRFPLMPTSA